MNDSFTNGKCPIETNEIDYKKTLTTAYNNPDYSGDAGKVLASGNGLNTFCSGVPASFEIDTANAGKQKYQFF